MIHYEARTKAIYDRIASRIKLIDSLENTVGKGSYPHLALARYGTEDVASSLCDLGKKDRTPAQEAALLFQAELLFQTWEPELKKIRDEFGKFGGQPLQIVR